jgi:cyclase
VATVFLRGDDALLVDTLASEAEAEWMHRHLVRDLRKRVHSIVATHYMNDHMAGLRFYPSAQIIAQRYFQHTFLSQRDRSAQDNENYVAPTVVFYDTLAMQCGRHALHLFHNPGKTLCSINIHVPSCDIAFAGDNIVGNIVYLSRAAPAMIDLAVARLQRLQPARVIGGHMGVFDHAALAHARHYLQRLRETAVKIHQTHTQDAATQAMRQISIESCTARGVIPSAFEREWHGRNIDVLIEQDVFKLDAVLQARWAAGAGSMARTGAPATSDAQ